MTKAFDAESQNAYDFIVCGAGSAGCVVAARLAENPHVRVLLIEAGDSDDVPEVLSPTQWASSLGSERDWGFLAEPNPYLHDRPLPLNMGRVLGGGSSIGAMVWSRGHQNDWDGFAAAAGEDGWNYASILAIYRRIEDWQGAADPSRRGIGGPVGVRPPRDPEPVALTMLDAAQSMGIPVFDSPNGAMMEGPGGAALNDLTLRNGRRCSIFRSYVFPKLGQPNLRVLTRAVVGRLLFTGTKVVGVEVHRGCERTRYTACSEVILSMGAINTPKVLMQSGIGPDTELSAHRISPIQHLPGVGRNHQDHICFGCIFESREPLAAAHGGFEAGLYWKTDSRLAFPDLFHFYVGLPVPTPETVARGTPRHGFTVFAGLGHPQSRGSVHLSGPEANDPVRIDTNTLSHPEDLRSAFAAIELCRELASRAPFRHLIEREIMPEALDGGEMDSYIRDSAVTIWNQCGTAKMGRDAMSVVNSRLQVYGVDNLRIADASIMPNVTTGGTMAPCVVIGERAAEMIKAAHRI